jgi:hypothetical protein
MQQRQEPRKASVQHFNKTERSAVQEACSSRKVNESEQTANRDSTTPSPSTPVGREPTSEGILYNLKYLAMNRRGIVMLDGALGNSGLTFHFQRLRDRCDLRDCVL